MLDQSGLDHSTDNPQALVELDAFVDAYARGTPDTMERLKTVRARAPELPSAVAYEGYLRLLSGRRAEVATVQRMLASYRRTAPPVNGRERAHLQACAAWCDDRLTDAVRIWLDLLERDPGDFLAVKLTQFAQFFHGQLDAMAAAATSAEASWDRTSSLYGFVQGVAAFGLEETQCYEDAEQLGRAAVSANADDLWGAHAVAHCLLMQERYEEGIDWTQRALADAPGYAMANHVSWHRGLFLLGAGHLEEAEAGLYNGAYSANSSEYMDLCNDISLAQRLELRGIDCRAAWERIRPRLDERLEDQSMIFCDAHYVLALGAVNDPELERVLGQLRVTASSQGDNARITAAVGLDLCAGLTAFRRGDYETALDRLSAIGDELVTIGGSNAQRQLFVDIRAFCAQQGRAPSA